MKTLSILLLTLTVSACSIQPLTNQNDPNDPFENTDQNEPNNGNVNSDNDNNRPNEHTNEPTFTRCPEVSACEGVEADCVVRYTTLCGDVARADFFCGDRHGYIFTNGAEFECEADSCACAIVDALDYCSALGDAR